MAWYKRFPKKKQRLFIPAAPMVAKLCTYWITVNFREAYGMYACNGILLTTNHPGGVKPL